jgi:hypothetical protein
MTDRKIGWLFIALFSLVSIGALGQFEESKEGGNLKFPRWVSDKGYWVVESNINSPTDHIIRFYNTGNLLVYKETLKGVKLNPERSKIKMKLKKILESSVLAWEKRKKGSEELAWVKAVL